MSTLHLAMRVARSTCSAAATEGMRTLALDKVTRHTTGFAEAWRTADGIPGWLTELNASAFWAVIEECRPKTVVEIGSYMGRSTALMGLALKRFSPDATLVAIDPHTGDRQHLERIGTDVLPTEGLFRQHMAGAGVEDLLDVRVDTSDNVAREWSRTVDLLYIDGWHSYEAVKSDSENWLPHLAEDGLVCFDDVGKYSEVRQAAREACEKLGLTVYGPVTRQMWAGNRDHAPAGLQAAIKWTRMSAGARAARF